jgi:ABC-type sugar transport system substrate-binding protein
MILGASRAVRANGKAEQVKLTGFDAIKEALEAIKDDDLLATVDNAPDTQAYESIKALVNYLNGKEVKSELSVSTTIIDDDNVDEALENR